MSGLRSRIEDEAGRKALLDIALRLESGADGADIAAEPGGDPISIVAALAVAGITPDGPPLVQGSPRRPKLKTSASEASLAKLFPRSSRPTRLALSAGLFQVLDFWEESHEAAQEAGDLGERPHSAYWHAIAHRREPDPGNAGYWFRRVGPHPVFEPLARVAKGWLDHHGDPGVTNRLLRNGAWDPMAFVALCRAGTPFEGLARRMQATEMILLLDATAHGLEPA